MNRNRNRGDALVSVLIIHPIPHRRIDLLLLQLLSLLTAGLHEFVEIHDQPTAK
jgi:hypothetical protein